MFRVVFIIVALRDPSLGREGSIKPQQFFHYLVPSSVYLCIFGANFSKRTRGKSIGDIERIQRSLYSSENMKLFSVSFGFFVITQVVLVKLRALGRQYRRTTACKDRAMSP